MDNSSFEFGFILYPLYISLSLALGQCPLWLTEYPNYATDTVYGIWHDIVSDNLRARTYLYSNEYPVHLLLSQNTLACRPNWPTHRMWTSGRYITSLPALQWNFSVVFVGLSRSGVGRYAILGFFSVWILHFLLIIVLLLFPWVDVARLLVLFRIGVFADMLLCN